MDIRQLLSYVSPQRLETFHSPINGEIIVEYAFGHTRISVGGFWQSGTYAVEMIQAAIPYIQKEPTSILVLGIAGGSMIRKLKTLYPSVAITGVDIDPVMVQVGKKYFGLDAISQSTYIVGDAVAYIKKNTAKFDVIVSDLFIGCDAPSGMYGKEFVKNSMRLLTFSGVFISNLSYRQEYQDKTKKYIEIVRKEASQVNVEYPKANAVVIALK